MTEFFRFPHTPHLAWLGAECPRDDKVLSSAEVSSFLAANVVVEEKLDGANLGISVGSTGTLRIQNRGQYLTNPYSGQFSRLASWLASREGILTEALGSNLILFGEWCAARHSIEYVKLPDWFLAFDIFDRVEDKFWSTARRDGFVRQLGLCPVPKVFEGSTTLERLQQLVIQGRSRFSSGPLEGVIIRRESSAWLELRTKLVHPAFIQSINEHWSRRRIAWNQLTTQ